ncbi:MAG: molybdenum cofactor guanylyltransferase [Firmicutes bacterium]|nr:molybdenum cofactor guanylyltransferase [Bacillota bacterium]
MELTVIILAGGRSRRMGVDKAGLDLAGERLLTRVYQRVIRWQPAEILISGPPRPWLAARYLPDPPGIQPSSLLGFYTGLLASKSRWNLVVGCDMPFVQREFVDLLWQHKNAGGAVARWQHRLQPLPGLYPATALEIITELFSERRYHLAALLDRLAPTALSPEQVAAVDPDGLSFFNINAPDDLTAAKHIMGT